MPCRRPARGGERGAAVTRRISTVVFTNNADLIADVAELRFRPDDVVLDVTFGRGTFWKKYRPANLIAHDIRLDGVDFQCLPEADSSADIVVFDPDYTSTGNKATSTIPAFSDRYGIGEVRGWQALFAKVGAGLKECARVTRRELLVKSADYVESGQRRFLHHHVVTTCLELGLTQVDELVLVRAHPGPQPASNLDGTPRCQEHAHQAHSFLSVFQVPR